MNAKACGPNFDRPAQSDGPLTEFSPSLGDHEKSQVGPLLGLVWGLVSGLVVGGLWAALVFISLVEVIDHRPTSSGSTNGHIPSDEFNGLVMRSLFCPSGPAQVIMGSLGL